METRRKGETNTESPRDGPPRGQPLRYAARMARAVRRHRGSWSSGKLAPLVCIPTRPACRTFGRAYLTLPPIERKGGRILPPTTRCDSPPDPSRTRRLMGRRPKAAQPIAEVKGRAKEAAPPFCSRPFLLRLSRCRIGGAELRGRKWIFVTRKGSPTLSVLMFSSCCCYCC